MFQICDNKEKDNGLLKWLSEDDLYAVLRSPSDSNYVVQIDQLRNTVFLNSSDARKRLSKLPFLVCANFNPMLYGEENFSFIEHFCVDVELPVFNSSEDYITWRHKLERDNQIFMSFISALGDKLHIFFTLRQRCYDRGLFQLFYREFTSDFFRRHNIDYVPTRSETDPCKPIYISIDPNVFCCIDPAPVVFDNYINSKNLEERRERIERNKQKSKRPLVKKEKTSEEPSTYAMAKIKSILKHKPIHQPASTDSSIKVCLSLFDQNTEELKRSLLDEGIRLDDIQSIRGGRKIILTKDREKATANIIFDNEGNAAIVFAVGTSEVRKFQVSAKSVIQKFIQLNISNHAKT